MANTSYQIKLPQFEGPFDLLLFFIERDELDIYNIPIHNITREFLDFLHAQQTLNIELSSEFILFVSTLMRIKAKMLLPRKELDAKGAEIDPRQELVDKILEYKRFKDVAAEMANMEQLRLMMLKRGNVLQEITTIGVQEGEGTEIQSLSLYKLMRTFERVMKRMHERTNKVEHVVVGYNYTMEQSREYIIQRSRVEGTLAFGQMFETCNNKIQAIFLFLSLLELVQQQFLTILIGEGSNNFIVEWNYLRPDDITISVFPTDAQMN